MNETQEDWLAVEVLVTGANGFTGQHLCRVLANKGANVRALVKTDVGRFSGDANITTVVGDLRDPKFCEQAVQGVRYVFNVAAVFRRVNVEDGELKAVHVDSVESLMRSAAQFGVKRFVHVSTVGVHGGVEGLNVDENSAYSPGDDYQQTKLDGEFLAFRLGKELTVPTTVIRPCAIYGPGDDRFLKFVKPIANKRFLMIGDGETHIHFIHVDDLVSGILGAALSDRAAGEAYIICDEQSVSLNRLSEIVEKLTDGKGPWLHLPYPLLRLLAIACEFVCDKIGIEPPLHRRRLAFFVKDRSFTHNKAHSHFGFVPKFTLEAGMKEQIDWFKTQKLI